MGKKSSLPSRLTFEESEQNDALMEKIFADIDDVPDKEPALEIPFSEDSSKKTRPSTVASVSGPDAELDSTVEGLVFLLESSENGISSAGSLSGTSSMSAKIFSIRASFCSDSSKVRRDGSELFLPMFAAFRNSNVQLLHCKSLE
jgi:hypothetical protein